MDFKKAKEKFNSNRKKEDGYIIMEKVSEIIKDVGNNFLDMNGGELAEAQSKLSGYKFFLADYIGELNRKYESLKLELKHIKAVQWDIVTEEIKARDGKVKNKEQIDNVLITKTVDKYHEQILYETLYFKYKLKISSIDSVLTTITQRISFLKKEIEKL